MWGIGLDRNEVVKGKTFEYHSTDICVGCCGGHVVVEIGINEARSTGTIWSQLLSFHVHLKD